MERISPSESVERLTSVGNNFCLKKNPSSAEFCNLMSTISACIDSIGNCENPTAKRKLLKLRVETSKVYSNTLSSVEQNELDASLAKLHKMISETVNCFLTCV